MTATATRVRVPGRARLGGVFSGDTPTFVALFALGWLVTTFFQLDWWRAVLFAGSAVPAPALLGLFAALVALGLGSLLGRSFLWAEPAVLTWLDFTGHDRVRLVSGRVWTVWSARLLVLGYVGALLAAAAGVPSWTWWTGIGLLGVGSLVVLPLAAGVGPPLRLPVAVSAGRQRLVDGWAARVVRLVSVTFLDPTMMLPSAGPVPGRPVRSLVALALVGVLGRLRFAVPALLLGVVVALAHVALPGLPDAVLVGIGAFAALLPFGGGIGQLWRSPGLRRWLDASDVALRAWHAVVFAVLALAWGLVVLAGTLLLGSPLAGAAWLAIPLAAAAVLRTATRPPVDYDAPGITDTPFGQAPVRLVAQVVRGPDLGAVGVWVLAAAPLGLVTVLVTGALIAWCVLR
ncbi:hypothetical protein DI005_02015 [Prauserella sp. PE36]|uniref:DUF6297 family protein n=1 Tax=Prauserella sp. PE36 TaxID=1504709 RepID=UPI000DE1E242|nr:DUF6297 family protein [Prauserella sp. PE36]RBM23742.1 hypothetical protein DI005_02015 [Prauserella sp. PE36]